MPRIVNLSYLENMAVQKPRIVNLSHLTQGVCSVPISVTRAAVGETIKIVCDLYTHYGIADGVGGVIHASKKYGKVIHTTWEEFSNGLPVYICDDITSGNLPVACERAKARVNEIYDLINFNCEHFVREVHGMNSESVQVKRVACTGAAVCVAAKAKDPVIKCMGVGATIGAANGEKPVEGMVSGAIVVLGVVGVCKILEKVLE